MSLPRWVEPQLTKLSTKAPSGPQWVHEIKLDGYRMAARIEGGRMKLLTRSGLDWTVKYTVSEPPPARSRSGRPISAANSAQCAPMASRRGLWIEALQG